MSQQVQFVYLTQAEYDSLSPKVESRLYFTSDTNKIYRGSTLYSSRLVEDLTNWDETNINFNELQAKTLQVEDPETKEMKNVSLEGHVHDEYLTSDDIKDFITADDLKDEVEFGSIEADELKVNGKDVSLDGHTHTKSEIDDFPTNVGAFTNDVGYLKSSELDLSGYMPITGGTLTSDWVIQSAGKTVTWDSADGYMRYDGADNGLSFGSGTFNEFETGSYILFHDWNQVTMGDYNSSQTLEQFIKSLITSTAHTHTKSQITDFAHTHTKSEITDFPTDVSSFRNDVGYLVESDLQEVEFGSIEADEIWLDGKQLTWDDILSTVDPSKIKAEELDWSTVEGMSFNTLTANSIKVNNTAVSLEGHTHKVSNITDLDLTKYALATHTHTKSEISDFAHTHTKSQITDFAHTHNISDITNLQTTLNGKSDDGHTHSVEDITDWSTTDIQFNSIDATSLTVNGKEVSVEGHKHNEYSLTTHTHPQYVTMQQVKDEMKDEVEFGSIEADELWLDGKRITADDIGKGGAEFQLKIPSQLVDKTIDKLVVNKLTSSEYEALKTAGTLNDEELYFVESNDVDILDAKGNAVVNVGNPVNLTDAATKGYVDTQVSNARQDVVGMETRIEENVKEYIDEVVEDTPGKIYLTDEGVGLDDTLSDAHVVKCTHEKYQWYLNNFTREELAKYVFVLESDVEDMLGKRVTRVGAPEEDADAATKKYVDDSLSAFTPSSGGKATDDYIQLVKPEFDDSKVYLSISFYEDFNMGSPALTIDSGDATQLQYFRAYLNSGNSRKWIVPSEQGLGSEHDYAPVCVLVKKYMEDNASEFDLVCASFYWYWKDGSGVQHKSDVCSSIFPATSELSGGLPFGFQVIEMRGTTAAGKNVKYKVLAKDVVEI